MTSRHRRCCFALRRSVLLAVTALAMAQIPTHFVAATTQTGGDGNGSIRSSSSAASAPPPSTANAPTTQGRGAGWFDVLSQLADGQVELRSVRGGSNWDAFCDGAPVIVTRSLSIPANGACPASWTNLSCTCVSELKSPQSAWSFRVAKRSAQLPLAAPIPANTSAASSAVGDGALVTVSSLGAFTVPPELTTLKLVGMSVTPLELPWDFNLLAGQLEAPVFVTSRSPSASLLRSVEVASISLQDVAIGADFLPPTLRVITLRNCSIKSLRGAFLSKHHPTLERLVLAGNALTKFESGLSAMVGDASALRELDLSDNELTGIPPDIFDLRNLTTLFLQGNPITNLSVSATAFALASQLTTFRIDAVDAHGATVAVCTGGEWRAAGASGVRLCVLADATHAPAASAPYLAVGVSLCAFAVAAALFCHRTRTRNRKRHASSLSLIESTGSHEFPTVEVDDALLRNPLLLLNRLPYKEVVVKQCVSRGGFGVVFRGEYKHRAVAVKKIRAEFHADAACVEAFLHEICLMASLSHPRIVEFVGAAWDALPNLSAVTEFMDRGDLRDVLQSDKKQSGGATLTWDAHKLRIALHVAEALTYLHALVPTVIHRDLKSKNVLLNAALDAKLSDFGISREWTVDDTHLTVGVGTSFWIAPEVLLGHKYDERADVFSLGVVLSELDTGEYPYAGAAVGAGAEPKAAEILRLVAGGHVRPAFTPECPRAVRALADLCLQSQPEHRPTSAHIVNVLRDLVAQGSDSGYPSSSSAASSLSLSSNTAYSAFY